MKKILAFDLDDTLAVTKSPISAAMADTLKLLLVNYDICVISGGKFEQFHLQIIDALPEGTRLEGLHLMPTCGTRYYRYQAGEWQLQYAEDLSESQKQRITEALEASARELGYWEDSPAGDIIEDRGSQITYSALGQQATPAAKYAWDPDGTKKEAIRSHAAARLSEFELRAGGTTSIDVTRKGIDKAYGMKKLLEATGLEKSDILFYGDKMQPGGNDYPVKADGIESIEVTDQEDTLRHLRLILATV